MPSWGSIQLRTICASRHVTSRHGTTSLSAGVAKVSHYEMLLHQIHYFHSKPHELNSRTFIVACSERNGRFASNELTIKVSGGGGAGGGGGRQSKMMIPLPDTSIADTSITDTSIGIVADVCSVVVGRKRLITEHNASQS